MTILNVERADELQVRSLQPSQLLNAISHEQARLASVRLQNTVTAKARAYNQCTSANENTTKRTLNSAWALQNHRSRRALDTACHGTAPSQ